MLVQVNVSTFGGIIGDATLRSGAQGYRCWFSFVVEMGNKEMLLTHTLDSSSLFLTEADRLQANSM